MPEETGYTREVAYKQVGPGWRLLLSPLYDLIEQAKEPEFIISTVKEKFGTMRIYAHATHAAGPRAKEYESLSREAQAASHHICERCGHLGQENYSSWKKITCPRHEPEFFIKALGKNNPESDDYLDRDPSIDQPAPPLPQAQRLSEVMAGPSRRWQDIAQMPDTDPDVLTALWKQLKTTKPNDQAGKLNIHNLGYIHRLLAEHPNTPDLILATLSKNSDPSLNLQALISNRSPLPNFLFESFLTSPDWRVVANLAHRVEKSRIKELLSHPSRMVRFSLASHPELDPDSFAILAEDPCLEVADRVLCRPDCPLSILTSALAKNPDAAPEIVMNPNTPPELLEKALLATKQEGQEYPKYSSALATNVVTRLTEYMNNAKNNWTPSKACFSWLLHHPDKEIRLMATRLMPKPGLSR